MIIMKHFYAIVKIIYFIVTIAIAVFFLGWDLLLWEQYNSVVWYLIPWYLLLCGIMIWYIITKLRIIVNESSERIQRIYLQWFIIGIIIGLWLAGTYVLLS